MLEDLKIKLSILSTFASLGLKQQPGHEIISILARENLAPLQKCIYLDLWCTDFSLYHGISSFTFCVTRIRKDCKAGWKALVSDFRWEKSGICAMRHD